MEEAGKEQEEEIAGRLRGWKWSGGQTLWFLLVAIKDINLWDYVRGLLTDIFEPNTVLLSKGV